MKKLILAIMVCLSMSACVPVLLVGSATAGGAIIYNKRSVKTMLRDRNISSAGSTLITKKFGNQARISVATYNGIVLMVGNAQSQAIKDQAQQIVAALPNVRRIYNEIIVGPSPSTKTTLNSGWITSKVRTSLLAKPGMRSTQIKVVTNQGVVYLMGWVSHAQARMAADVARRVTGVKKVVTVFEYED